MKAALGKNALAGFVVTKLTDMAPQMESKIQTARNLTSMNKFNITDDEEATSESVQRFLVAAAEFVHEFDLVYSSGKGMMPAKPTRKVKQELDDRHN